VRRGAIAAAVITLEIHVFVLLFRRDRLSVFLTPGWEARRRRRTETKRSARRWESVGRGTASDKHVRSFGAQPRSAWTEKARSAHDQIVRWAVHPRKRSGLEGNDCDTIQRPC
jgi:hypothetical protein